MMDKPKPNYKGMGAGPIGKKLASAKMPHPTILHAGGGRMAHKIPQTYHPPHGSHRGPSIEGILARKRAEEREEESGMIRSTKADQGLDRAMQEWQLHLQQAKALGIDVDDLEHEGGM